MYGSPSPRALAPLALLIALGVALPQLLPGYFLYVGNMLMLYAVLALGLDLLVGWAGQFAFAHIAFFGVGAYGTILLQSHMGLSFAFGMPISATLAGALAYIIAVAAIRLHAVYLALATFAFAESIQWLLRSWDSLTGGADGLRITTPIVLGWMTGTDQTAFPVMAIILALMIAATQYLVQSKFGRAMCATRDNEHAATASGINVRGVRIWAFVISGVYAGIAGGMFTLFQSFVDPDVFGFEQLVLILSMIVVGGLATLPGVLIGAVLLGLVPEVMRTTMRSLLVWQELVYGLILMLTMMFMPRGIWGLICSIRAGRAS